MRIIYEIIEILSKLGSIIAAIIAGVFIIRGARIAAKLVSEQTYRKRMAIKRLDAFAILQSNLAEFSSQLSTINDKNIDDTESFLNSIFRYCFRNRIFIGKNIYLVWKKYYSTIHIFFVQLRSAKDLSLQQKSRSDAEWNVLSHAIRETINEFQDKIAEAIQNEIKNPNDEPILSNDEEAAKKLGITCADAIYKKHQKEFETLSSSENQEKKNE